MEKPGRRDLLRLGATAGVLGLAPPSIRRALALPSHSEAGSIEDVAHIVVFMQENRSFDHYFGHLSGVRGYNDRHPVRREDGRPVWYQPRRDDAEAAVLPFHLSTQHTSAECVLDLDHNWYPTQAALAAGRNDRWPAHKSDMTMGYYTRDDIPFHYALADAFTICDNYFCSTPTQTHPNRMYLMTGMVDPTGAGGGPLLDNVDYVDRQFFPRTFAPFTWTTYPERLQAAGISWQVYQQGLSVTDNYEGNFGTNVLMNFRQFIDAPEGSPLQRRGMSQRTLDDLAADVRAGRLPQVSWLLPPAAYSEHPRWTPGYGATYMARVLDALTANPEVWARTVLLVMYDENDGYFDHVVPPQPPTPVRPGKSTISTAGEIHDYVSPFDTDKFKPDNLPYGLGPRVGAMAISPWSRGGYVCSEVFDHTSVLRFIEARFGVSEPNITPWRRAVCGDLTSCFDFSRAQPRTVSLPSTRDYIAQVDASCGLPKPGVPATSTAADVGPQEPGTRPTRPLPYAISVAEVSGDKGAIALRMENAGHAAVCLYAYAAVPGLEPRRYTIGTGAGLDDQWALPLSLTLTGPNGFVRRYDRPATATVAVSTHDRPAADAVAITLRNPGDAERRVRLTDLAYGAPPMQLTVPPRDAVTTEWAVAGSHHWYDVAVVVEGGGEGGGGGREETRLAGHVETGRDSVTDPAAREPLL